jgi:carboxyl-terminal processing protease
VSRYYLQKGIQEASFDNDVDVLEALTLFKDPARYQKTLKGK